MWTESNFSMNLRFHQICSLYFDNFGCCFFWMQLAWVGIAMAPSSWRQHPCLLPGKGRGAVEDRRGGQLCYWGWENTTIGFPVIGRMSLWNHPTIPMKISPQHFLPVWNGSSKPHTPQHAISFLINWRRIMKSLYHNIFLSIYNKNVIMSSRRPHWRICSAASPSWIRMKSEYRIYRKTLHLHAHSLKHFFSATD